MIMESVQLLFGAHTYFRRFSSLTLQMESVSVIKT